MYQKSAERPNQPPSDGLQFFGQADIDGDTGVMTVVLKDLAGGILYAVELEPGPRGIARYASPTGRDQDNGKS